MRARINDVTGDLVNVSATGALIRARRALGVCTEWPLVLDSEVRRIALSGRVVRCESAAVELPGGAILKRTVFALGVVFTAVSSAAMHNIVQLCGGTLKVEALPHRILLVDEDPSSSGALTQTLTDLRYEVRSVADARQVIDAAKDCRADAVVIHLASRWVPSMWWALEVLRSDPATARLPIVAVTTADALDVHRPQYLAERKVHIVTGSTAEALEAALQRALQLPLA